MQRVNSACRIQTSPQEMGCYLGDSIYHFHCTILTPQLSLCLIPFIRVLHPCLQNKRAPIPETRAPLQSECIHHLCRKHPLNGLCKACVSWMQNHNGCIHTGILISRGAKVDQLSIFVFDLHKTVED